MLQKDHGFDQEFNIFHEINNSRKKLYEYKPKIFNDINSKKWNARVIQYYGKLAN